MESISALLTHSPVNKSPLYLQNKWVITSHFFVLFVFMKFCMDQYLQLLCNIGALVATFDKIRSQSIQLSVIWNGKARNMHSAFLI